MKKFSVIIPTMYLVDHLASTLKTLNALECVHEIIVIENAQCPYDKTKLDKIVYIDLFTGIGCNPAWNLAIKIASADYVCLLSDDILFNFEKLLPHLLDAGFLDQAGIIGLGANCYTDTRIHSDENITIVHSSGRGYGFGSCMFLAKNNFVPIPNELKVLWGDEWLYRHQTKPNYEITNLHTNNLVGVTSGRDLSILENDTKYWQTLGI